MVLKQSFTKSPITITKVTERAEAHGHVNAAK
jgi:hypothetical protein